MRLGPCVTNPAVREVTVASSLFATLNLISNGRMQMGIGRGDSSRRVLGKKPTTLENLEDFVKTFRDLNAGKTVDLEASTPASPGRTENVPRVWVAGYGPKALRTAGRIGGRRHPAIRRSRLDRLVPRFRPRRRERSGPRLQQD